MRWLFGDFTLDQERRQLLRAGSPLLLTPKAYELLSLLLARRPRALSKAQIRDVLWPGTSVSESALAALVADLRSVFGEDARRPSFIRTVHGFDLSRGNLGFDDDIARQPVRGGRRTRRLRSLPCRRGRTASDPGARQGRDSAALHRGWCCSLRAGGSVRHADKSSDRSSRPRDRSEGALAHVRGRRPERPEYGARHHARRPRLSLQLLALRVRSLHSRRPAVIPKVASWSRDRQVVSRTAATERGSPAGPGSLGLRSPGARPCVARARRRGRARRGGPRRDARLPCAARGRRRPG
jgi:hypothetical protein